MSAVLKQTWSIDPSVDITDLSVPAILFLFQQSRDKNFNDSLRARLDQLGIEEKLNRHRSKYGVNEVNRKLFLFREFFSLADAQAHQDWLTANYAPSYPVGEAAKFSQFLLEVVDNTDLDQVS